MTNDQISRINMFHTTVVYSIENSGIVKDLPEYSDRLTTLQSIIVQIQVVSELQKTDKTWITKQKNLLQAELVDLVVDTARKLTAYARFTKNQSLMGDVNITESAFKHFADSEVKDYARLIYDRAQPLVESLVKYAITEDTQTALINAINEYNAILGDPRYGIINKSQATDSLVELIKAGEAVLADMDAAVEIVHKSQPIFYNGYHAARRIISTGAGKLSLKMKVLDSLTGEPIKGAIASITLESNSKNVNEKLVVIEKKMAKMGGANIKTLASGTYIVTIRKVGYTDQTVVININDGEITILNVSLVKN